MEPPATVMSPTTKLDDASESVNVMTTVWPDLREPDPARAMVTVGNVVSVVITSVPPHWVFSFPAMSAYEFGEIHNAAVPLATFAVGVKVAE